MPRVSKKIEPKDVQENKENAKSPSPAPPCPPEPAMPSNPPAEKPAKPPRSAKKPKESKLRNIGSKEEVYNGLAQKTGGRLKKDDLIMNSRGQIVSKKKHELGIKNPNFKKKQ